MRRALTRVGLFLLIWGLTACSAPNITTEEESSVSQHNVLVVYTAEAAQAAEEIQAALGTDRAPLEEADAASYEYVFLGFETQNDKLPDEVRQFLADADWGGENHLCVCSRLW